MTPFRPRGQSIRDVAARDLAGAGGIDAPIQIVEYDPSWPAQFAAEYARLKPLLPAAEIHHVGSTAVPGLAAKPVIDIMALVSNLDEPIPVLVERGGYEFPRHFNATLSGRRWLCHPTVAHRTHHLHLVDTRAELVRHLRFRDTLRSNRSLAADYEQLKRTLAELYRDDREAYTNAKSAFIQQAQTAD